MVSLNMPVITSANRKRPIKVEELPTLLLYENKNLKWKSSGFVSEEDLKKQIL